MHHNNITIENKISTRLINTICGYSKIQRETYQDRYLKKMKKENEKRSNDLTKIFKILFNNHDYDSMLNMINLMNLNKHEEEKLIAIIKLYKNWDLFEYDKLVKYKYQGLPSMLQPIDEKHRENIKALQKLSTKYRDYRLVIDLINNAKRRNQEGKYNEAVIQLYRAMELATQLKLKKVYKIDTADVSLKRLEELKINKHFIEYLKNFTNSYNNIHLSLKDQLYILKGLKDPMGKFYWNNQDLFMDIIEMRHSSLLVHGNTNITILQYQEYEYLVKEFVSKLNKNIKKYIKCTQFPEFDVE
ncbi:MAG: hypothetical protein E7Z85_04530 [Methanosphaera stadtmanae]|nr:hypothetical protein [Methanosphaera stadtmanae]